MRGALWILNPRPRAGAKAPESDDACQDLMKSRALCSAHNM